MREIDGCLAKVPKPHVVKLEIGKNHRQAQLLRQLLKISERLHGEHSSPDRDTNQAIAVSGCNSPGAENG